MRISDWSSDVCSSDLPGALAQAPGAHQDRGVIVVEMLHRAHHVPVPVGTGAGQTDRRCIDQLLMQHRHPVIEAALVQRGRLVIQRSEERRVGKEGASQCSYWWWPYT